MDSFSFRYFLCIILFLSVIISGSGAADETEEEEENELDLTVFGRNLETIENELKRMKQQPQVARSLLSKLGKIALYFRLYRSSITSPMTGHHGFDSFFPQPTVEFHRYLYEKCSGSKIKDCVDEIFASIQPRAKFMFPLKDQPVTDLLRLDVDDFARRVSNSKFSFDMSVSYLFCFFTKNKLSVLEYLPFCSYGIEPEQVKMWPAGPFRQFVDSSELSNNRSHRFPLDPIDTFLNQTSFECADVSFCPDPCCGRKSLRFFRGGDNSKSAKNQGSFGFCAHSACAMNVKNLNEKMAARHFKKKTPKEELPKGAAEGDGEGTTERMPSTTEEAEDLEEDEEERHNATEAGNGVVNTHYCYLESPFNDDLFAIMQNRWNLSCACASADGSIDNSKIYRFDVLQCVDLDECLYEECPKGQQCLNMNKGKICACPVGSYKSKDGRNCNKVPVSGNLKELLEAPFY
ncbi:hypothetical protein niasHS_017451 [Heterodera schachtii]|uniref:EGF-like domain-containing protein n=1 Tax=Heterodera schachtii TaxID=97005 RepID=A0ABD2I0H1_HETSC